MNFNVKEEIIKLTPQWKGERLPDGRPKVDVKYLKALKNLTLEEVWKPIFVKGNESQFEGRFHTLHDDGRKLIGHAVGGVCPFAVNDGVKVYLDESLKRFDTVFPACGSSNSAIEVTVAELEKLSKCDEWQKAAYV